MTIHRTYNPPRFRDSWSFSGNGRLRVIRSGIEAAKRTVVSIDENNSSELGPGEPRG